MRRLRVYPALHSAFFFLVSSDYVCGSIRYSSKECGKDSVTQQQYVVDTYVEIRLLVTAATREVNFGWDPRTLSHGNTYVIYGFVA